MKIALIGPIFPWKGGISHHSSNLVQHLREEGADVHVFSFYFLYPRCLYPGKKQKESPSNHSSHESKNISYTINPINPLSWYRTYKIINSGKFDYCIFRYWHFYFLPCFYSLALLLRGKISICCIIDNLFSHDSSLLEKWPLRPFINSMHFCIAQSDFVYKQFVSFFPFKKIILLKHPIYDNFGPKIDTVKARNTLKIPTNKIILLFFGFIRPYKGLDVFLSNFVKLLEYSNDIYLVIAGECFGSYKPYEKIIKNNGIGRSLRQNISYIPTSEIPLYFSAADIFLMPYRSATNSGVMEIAKYYNLPILASDIDALRLDGVFNVDFTNFKMVSELIHRIPNNQPQYSNNTWGHYAYQLIQQMRNSN